MCVCANAVCTYVRTFLVQQNVNTNRCRPCRCHKMNLSYISKFNSTLHNTWFIFTKRLSMLHSWLFLVVRFLIVTCVQPPQFHLFYYGFMSCGFSLSYRGTQFKWWRWNWHYWPNWTMQHADSGLFFHSSFRPSFVHIVHTTQLPNRCRHWFTSISLALFTAIEAHEQ